MKAAVQRMTPTQWKVFASWLVLMNVFAIYTYLNLYGEVGALSQSLGRVEELLKTQPGAEAESGEDGERVELAERRLEEALHEIDRLDPSKKTRKEEFQHIWDSFEWSREDRSGPGSTVQGSANARASIQEVIRKYNIRTMLDAPCGTFSWMPLIDMEALNVTYVGVDIVPGNIDNARARWPSKQPHTFQFYCADVVDGFEFVDKLVLQSKKDYPTNTHDWSRGWDLIVTREFLQHIPHSAVKRVLRNFNNTGSKYLLLTHDPCCGNKDINFGDYQSMDVKKPPFNLGEPLAQFKDVGNEQLLLYKLPLTPPSSSIDRRSCSAVDMCDYSVDKEKTAGGLP